MFFGKFLAGVGGGEGEEGGGGRVLGKGLKGVGLRCGSGSSCMSGTPAATMRATNSSASMVRELVLMVSMKDAAEYCTEVP